MVISERIPTFLLFVILIHKIVQTLVPITTEDKMNATLGVVPEDTVGNALDVVTNFISRLDPSTWLARNASKAFGILCSAPKEWYDAYFEGKTAERKTITAANKKIDETITGQIVQQINVPPEYVQMVVNKRMGKIVGEQFNLDNISAIAANELKNEQSDNSTNQGTNEPNKKQSADSSTQGADSGEEKVIDDDWLNSFETEARQKSSEEMQLRFGRILAGEIKRPGSYSIKAVKILGELDQNTAALFKKLSSACVVLGIQNNEHVIDARVPSLGGNAGSNALKKYGLGFDQLNILNEYRLIISDYNSWRDYNLCIMNQNNPILLPFQYQGKYWILLSTPERDNNSEFRLSGVMLSRVGCELFSIVDQDPMPDYTDDLKKYFASQKLQMVEVRDQ